MEQSEIYETFGLDAPESENTGEVAEPQSENNGEVAEPQPENTEPQSVDERRRQAAARRKREYDEAISRAREEGRKEAESRFAEVLKKSDLENPMGGDKIQTMEELEAYNQARFARQFERDLQDGTLSMEQFNQLITQNPSVQKLLEQDRAIQAERERADEAERLSRARDEINRVISAEITPHHPEVKVMEDLFELDQWPEIQERINKGYSLEDAYRLSYWDQNLQSATAQAERQGRQSVQGRQHLKTTRAQGGGMQEVPADLKRNFLLFNPKATDEEMRAYYNRHLQ